MSTGGALPRRHGRAATWIALTALCALALFSTPGASAARFPGIPDPGGSELTKVSVPPPAGKYFGFLVNTPISDSLQMTPSIFANLSSEAGANAARITLDWRYMESNRDEWDTGSWNLYQDIYSTWRAAGITPVFTLCCAPVWARDNKPILEDPQLCTQEYCHYPPSRAMDSEWAEFVTHVAQRFPQAILQIWNEPNLPQFWSSGPDPKRYNELASIAYHAIKRVSPSTIVLAGDLAANQTTSAGEGSAGKPGIPMATFLEDIYSTKPNIRKSMDGLALHTLSQDTKYGAGTLDAKLLSDARRIAAAHHDRKRHFWLTEAGLSTTGNGAVSERVQADSLMRQYRRFMTMPDVDGVLFNSLTEMPSVPWNNTNRGYGMVRFQSPNFPPKLAFCAFADRVNVIPPTGCPALWEPRIPGISKALKKHAKLTCKKWFRDSPLWRLADSEHRRSIISACVDRYIEMRQQGILAPLKSSSRQSCRTLTPPPSHWRHHGVTRRRAAIKSCTNRLIRRGLNLNLG